MSEHPIDKDVAKAAGMCSHGNFPGACPACQAEASPELSKNKSRTPKLDVIMDRLRSPEAHTPYTEVLRSHVQEYCRDIFAQKDLPEVLKKFKERKGIIVLIGSVLRGTAREGSSDLDTITMYDSGGTETPDDKVDNAMKLSGILNGDYHPEHLRFDVWFARRLKNDPQLVQFFEARRSHSQTMFEKRRARHPTAAMPELTDEFIEGHFMDYENFINFDTAHVVQSISQDTIDNIRSADAETSHIGLIVPPLLTTTSEFVVESVPGSLQYHQNRVVQALKERQEHDPHGFQEIYGSMGKSFRGTSLYEGGHHGVGREHYEQLLTERVRESGRFAEATVGRAAGKLRAVKRQIEFPSLEEFEEAYLKSKNIETK